MIKVPVYAEKLFLTVDLDFWFSCDTIPENHLKQINQLWDMALTHSATYHHHKVLAHVNQSDADMLINIDYHSDLADNFPDGSVPELNCGTWVNRVEWGKQAQFVWGYPERYCFSRRHDRSSYGLEGSGMCHVSTNPFIVKADKVLLVTSWAHVSAKLVSLKPPCKKPLIELHPNCTIIGMNVTLSEDFGGGQFKHVLQELAKRKSVKIDKTC